MSRERMPLVSRLLATRMRNDQTDRHHLIYPCIPQTGVKMSRMAGQMALAGFGVTNTSLLTCLSKGAADMIACIASGMQRTGTALAEAVLLGSVSTMCLLLSHFR